MRTVTAAIGKDMIYMIMMARCKVLKEKNKKNFLLELSKISGKPRWKCWTHFCKKKIHFLKKEKEKKTKLGFTKILKKILLS
jgi:hypothetical protein